MFLPACQASNASKPSMLGGDEMETMKRAARDALNGWFGKVAAKIAVLVGSPWAFGLAVGAIVVWAALGPRYHYSDTWQLIVQSPPHPLFRYLSYPRPTGTFCGILSSSTRRPESPISRFESM